MAESLFYTHRQIVEEVRSRAGLLERRAGHPASASQAKDAHEVAQWATDSIMEGFQNLGVRNPDTLTRTVDRFTWPADTEAIALAGPPLAAGHPRLTASPAFVDALYDESSGERDPVPIEFADLQAVSYAHGARGISFSRQFFQNAVLRGTRLELHPRYAPSVAMRIDYVAWPDVVDPEAEGLYLGLPIGVLRAVIAQAAGELAAVVGKPTTLLAISERRMKSALRFQQRMERWGPRFMNYMWTPQRGV